MKSPLKTLNDWRNNGSHEPVIIAQHSAGSRDVVFADADVLAKASVAHRPQKVFADAGYDAEWVHRFCREDWQVESVIKPAVHLGRRGQWCVPLANDDRNTVT